MELPVQSGQLFRSVHGAAGTFQHQLPERRRRRSGVRRQPCQTQRQRAALFCAVLQRPVHQPFIGEGQRVLGYARGGGGRRLAVPQLQKMHPMAHLRQRFRQPPPQLGIGRGGKFHAVQNQ